MNTNPSALRVLCFGDSNTWGYISGSHHERYSTDKRWTGILQDLLGTDYEIIEEGLNSRTIESSDNRPGKEGRSASDYILPCLDTHDPLDLIIVLLGTNELKLSYNLSAGQIADMMEAFILKVAGRPSQYREIKPKILIVSPPGINEDAPYCQEGGKYVGAREKAIQVSDLYETIAEKHGYGFLDAIPITETGPDGVHLTEEAHRRLAERIAEYVTRPTS